MSTHSRRIAQSDQLLSSTQVRQMLDISPSTLTALVDKGVIQKVTPPGRKHGFYTRESVEEYKRQQDMFIQTYTATKKKTLEARKATEDEQAAIFEMEREVLGLTVPLERRLEWHRKNPYIDFIVISGERVMGHLSLVPLVDEALQAKMKGQLYGRDIAADKVETYETGKRYNLFVMAMAVRPDEKGRPNRLYAGLLLREAQRSLFELAYQGKFIRAIYAYSRTRDGIYLLERLQFAQLPEYSERHRKSFVLDLAKSKAPWAKEYRDYIASLKLPASTTQGILGESD